MSELKTGRDAFPISWSARPARLTKLFVGVLCLASLLIPSRGVSATLAAPYSLTLGWDPALSSAVVGYHLYYGTNSGHYTSGLLTGNVTTLTVTGLSRGVTYFFVIACTDATGAESALSSEVSYRQELPGGAQLQITSRAGGPFTLAVSGTSGHTYDVAASTNLTAWSVIGTVTLDATGEWNFTDPAAADFPQRFYRTEEKP